MIFSINDYLVYSAGTQDMTVPVQRMLTDAEGKINTILKFPRNTYHFFNKKCMEKYLFISNHDQGLKNIAFMLENRNNITIDGGGSEFIFHGRILPFAIQNSRNVTIQNLSIDYARPFFSEGEVLEADHEHVILQINSEEYPYYIEDNTIHFYSKDEWDSTYIKWFMEFDAKKRTPAYKKSESGLKTQKVKATQLDKDIVSFEAHFKELHTPGNVINITHEQRYNPAFFIDESENITLNNITIYHAAAMGIIGQNSRSITLEQVTVQARKCGGRYVSANNDATHFVNCEGLIKLVNCLFEHQLDDGSNIHGIYNRVSAVYSEKIIEVENMHFQQYGVCVYRAGDEIAIADPRSQYIKGHAVVEKVVKVNQHFMCLHIDSDILVTQGDVVDNISRYPEVIVRNCRMGHNRARALLLSSNKKMIVENCEFYSAGSSIRCGGNISNNWYESGPINDLIIRNNRFTNCCYAKWGPAIVDFVVANEECLFDNKPLHGSLSIINNEFYTFQPKLLRAPSLKHLEFIGNTVRHSHDFEPFIQSEHLLELGHCLEKTIEKNTLDGFEADKLQP